MMHSQPSRLCIYCGRELKKVAHGEHIVPQAIGGTVTIYEVCNKKLVCNTCNNGVLSDLDKELCSKSPMSLIAAQELKRTIDQSWDVDYSDKNLLVEAEPLFGSMSMRHYPQLIFDGEQLQLRGDYESMRQFGRERFEKTFIENMLDAFRAHKRRNRKRRLHCEAIPENASIGKLYRFPPRVFSRKPIENFEAGMSFQVRYLKPTDLQFVLNRLDQWKSSTRFENFAVRKGAEIATLRVVFDRSMVVRALAKIAINLLAAFCEKTPINRDACSIVIRSITGEVPIHEGTFEHSGFLRPDGIKPISVDGTHSFRLLHNDRGWQVYSSFFGGRIGSLIHVPGKSLEEWRTADIVMPLDIVMQLAKWTFRPSPILQPLSVRVESENVAKMIPSVEMLNPVTERRVSIKNAKRRKV
jgi:hypothetical protein